MDSAWATCSGASSTADFIEFVAEVDPRAGLHVLGQHAVHRRRAEPPLSATPTARSESIMVEINKKHFMDVPAFKKNEGFDAVQRRGARGAAGRRPAGARTIGGCNGA